MLNVKMSKTGQGMPDSACNLSIWKAEARGLQLPWDQPELYGETLSQKTRPTAIAQQVIALAAKP